MEHKLIDELLDSIQRFSEMTGLDDPGLAHYAMIVSGGMRVAIEGATGDPFAPGNLHKKYGDVAGRFTLRQVRDHLVHLVEDEYWLEDVLVLAVVIGIRGELESLADSKTAEATIARLRESSEAFLKAASAPDDDHPLLMSLASDWRVGPDLVRKTLRHMAEMGASRAEEIPAELPRYQEVLRAWQAVSAPLVTSERRSVSRAAQFDQITLSWRGHPLDSSFGDLLRQKYGDPGVES